MASPRSVENREALDLEAGGVETVESRGAFEDPYVRTGELAVEPETVGDFEIQGDAASGSIRDEEGRTSAAESARQFVAESGRQESRSESAGEGWNRSVRFFDGIAKRSGSSVSGVGSRAVPFSINGISRKDPGKSRAGAGSSEVSEPSESHYKPLTWRGKLLYEVLRYFVLAVSKMFYRIDVSGWDHLPDGPSIIAPNHVSYEDPPLIGLALKKRARFVMHQEVWDYKIFKLIPAKWIFRALGAIPVAREMDEDQRNAFINEASALLRAGERLVIFPEGGLSRNGNLTSFDRGYHFVAKHAKREDRKAAKAEGREARDFPVVPVHLDGLWGSFTSERKRKKFRLRRPIQVRFGKPIATREARPHVVREAVQVLAADNLTERLRKTKRPLGFSFLETAKKNWKKAAVADSTGQDLTYGDVLTGAIGLSKRLEDKLTEQENVGVLLPQGAGGTIANTALSVMGKVSVNFDYTQVPKDVAYQVENSDAEKIITSRLFLKLLKRKGLDFEGLGFEDKFIFLEDIKKEGNEKDKKKLKSLLRWLPKWLIEKIFFKKASRDLDDTATIIYTSGSTSRPKGVELSHLNIVANVEMTRNTFDFEPDEKVLGVLPFFHSFGLTATLWLPMLSGFSAVFHGNPLETDTIEELALKYKPTIVLGTPKFISLYVRRVSAEAFSNIRLAVAGAAKVRVALQEKFFEKFGTPLLEGYGATELTAFTTANVHDPEDVELDKDTVEGRKHIGNWMGTVGKNPAGSAIRIVDRETFDIDDKSTWTALPTPKPKHEEDEDKRRDGRILIYGPHVMKGYYKNPEKTAEVLRDGWYHTGDIGFLQAEGDLTIVDRDSRFTKVGGQMVSDVEVETALLELTGGEEDSLAVTGRPDPNTDEKLVVLYTEEGLDVAELHSRMVKTGMTPYKIPKRKNFFWVEALPFKGSGKIDIVKLRELAAKHDPYQEPKDR